MALEADPGQLQAPLEALENPLLVAVLLVVEEVRALEDCQALIALAEKLRPVLAGVGHQRVVVVLADVLHQAEDRHDQGECFVLVRIR